VVDAATIGRIEQMLSYLRMPTIRRNFQKVCKEVSAAGGDYVTFLHAILEEEVDERRARRIERRIKGARFRQEKLLSELDVKALPKGVTIERLNELASGAYIEDAMNIIAIGNSGTGKSHVCVALGMAACQQGRRVKFFTATELTCELQEAQDQHNLHRYLRRFAKWEVVVIDELGYLPISESAAELLFQALSERHEFGSVIINSNLPFGEWAKVFKSESLAVALLDRITHKAHVLEMNGDSYRLASARKAKDKREVTTKS
jgi:DNA replication protein DnaC